MKTITKVKHTPGPWKATYYNKSDEWTIRADGDEDIPIVRTFGFESLREDGANARLIAAAPELLEALKDAYMALYAGNSISLEDAMNRMPLNADGLERKIVQAIKKAE